MGNKLDMARMIGKVFLGWLAVVSCGLEVISVVSCELEVIAVVGCGLEVLPVVSCGLGVMVGENGG